MKKLFTSVLNALLCRKNELNNNMPVAAQLPYQIKSSSSKDVEVKRINADRCQRVLNYWLDTELFDLPECPIFDKNKLLSVPADKFAENWGQEAEKKYESGKLKITKDSRLLVMFQCHRAGYIAKNDERHPNYKIPRTYLVAQAMIPRWDEVRNSIVWSRSEEDQDLIINLATIRTLYRRCRPSAAANMSLSDWVKARMENIESMLHTGLAQDDEDTPLDTDELQRRIITINRELAGQFWPDEQAREYMLQQCQPIESGFQDDKLDQPGRLSDGGVTFRWRCCYYPDGSESQQLGPFFVDDLERIIARVEKEGTQGISEPLQAYLLGKKEQIEIGNAVNQGKFFWPLTNGLIYGRWPEKPQHGLCLLQTVAVNVARKAKDNPVVAVNGPPGTGKTTLLKDIIADKFVARTLRLKELSKDEGWVTKEEVTKAVMQYSMVVASSNNKAVENISKELPSLAKLPNDFAGSTRHFRELAFKGDWGLFCAILGNSSNRKAFKPLLKKLREHMNNVSDYFQLNDLVNSMKKQGKEEASDIFLRFVNIWCDNGRLNLLANDIKQCPANRKYSMFFNPFTSALAKIEQGELTVEQFSSSWSDISEVQWSLALEAIETFKKQWFAKKLYQGHLQVKLKEAEKSFDFAYAKISKLSDGIDSEWQLDSHTHLIGPEAYLKGSHESIDEAEKRLQLSSPLGSKALNQCRSELFVKALSLNEAILENAAGQFSKHWEQLEQLIDGRLETKETNPEHQKLWSLLFLFFPVVSTSLSSVESQFKLMQRPGGFGLAMIDEAGQAVNYHVAGLLQRSQQAIFVGDPIQLEPVVTMPPSIDLAIAADFLPISRKDGERQWGDDYQVSASSAQSVADNASNYMSKIGQRKVGIPLLVHRRCTEPMFSVANKIAYDNRMVLASQPFEWQAIQSGWIHVAEQPSDILKQGYANEMEANTALELVKFLIEEQPKMAEGGIYVITPFSVMRRELRKLWKQKAESPENHEWMREAFGVAKQEQDIELYAEDNIGTVHTFQGKEASTVILCTAASKIRNKEGGINWVNSKPNLLNVAVTRAKHHLFVVGNMDDWLSGTLSSELQQGGMLCYDSIDHLKSCKSALFQEQSFENKLRQTVVADVKFDFG